MSDRFAAWVKQARSVARFLIGQRIRIRHGTLAGYRGVVSGSRPGQRYLLTVDRLPTGVLVILDAAAIEQATGQRAAGR